MKRTIIIIGALLAACLLFAKEHSIDATGTRKLEINHVSGSLSIIGVSGNTITISGEAPEAILRPKEPAPDKADGLTELTASADNTGLGLVFEKDGSTITIESSIPMGQGGDYEIRVPAGMDVSINRSPFGSESLRVNKISGELSISSVSGDVDLKDITGPLTLNAVNGDARVSFSKLSQEGPTSLSIVNGDLDVYLPATTPADLELSALMGRIFTDFEVEGKKEKPEKAYGLQMVGGANVMDGKINGGGAKLILSNVSGSIYIRKK